MVQREKVVLELEDRLSNETKKAEGAMGGLKTAVAAVATAAVVQKFASLVGETTRLAISAGEAGSAFDTTFGVAADSAGEFVESFANKAGLANFELEQMLAITGNVIQGIGGTEQESADLSETMARLAGDVASFTNAAGGSQDVLLALQSAINGEREALKTYGLAISEAEVQERALMTTGKEAAGELSRLEKAHATVALAAEKAGKAVGDLDRTSDSAANRMRELGAGVTEAKVKLGEAALVILEDLFPALESLIGLAGRAASGVGTFASGIRETVFNLRTAFGSLPGEVGAAEGSLRFVIRQMEAGVPQAEALAQGLADVAAKSELTTLSSSIFQDQLKLTDEELLAGVEAAMEGAEAYSLYNDEFDSLIDVSRILEERLAATAREAAENGRTMGDSGSDTAIWAAVIGETIPVLSEQEKKLNAVERALQGDIAATAGLRAEQQGLLDDLRAQSDPIFNLVREWETLQQALEDPEANLLDVAEANLDVQEAMDGMNPQQVERSMEAIALAAGVPIEEVQTLLEEMGLLDGLVVTPVIDLQVRGDTSVLAGRPPAGRRPTLTGGVQMAGGGLIPGAVGQPVSATLHGQERVLSADQNRIFERLVGAITSGPQIAHQQNVNSRSTTVQQFNEGFLSGETSVEETLGSAEIHRLLEDFIGVGAGGCG